MRALLIVTVSTLWTLCSLQATTSNEEQPSEQLWEETLRAAREAQSAGAWEDALAGMEKALELARALEANPQLVPETLDALALHYERRWMYAEAVAACEEAVEVRGRYSTTPLLERGSCNHKLRYLYEKVEAWDKVEALLRERLAQLGRSQRPDDSRIASELRSLANLLGKIRPDDPEIETLMLEALGLAQDEKDELRALSSLGYHYHRQERHSEAAEVFERTLAMARRLEPGSDLSSRQLTLAREYRALGEYDRTEALMRSAIELRTEYEGADDITVTQPIFRLGRLLAEQGRYEEAEPYLRRAVEMTDAALGEDHSGYEFQRRELRRVLEELGRTPEEEAPAAPELEAECECPYDVERVRELERRGQRSEALGLVQEALAEVELSYGPDALIVAEVLGKIGSLEWSVHPLEALTAYQRSLRILERRLPLEDRRIATTASSLARLSQTLGDLDQATEYRLQQIESIRSAGGRSYSLAEALDDLAYLRRSAGDELESLEYFELAASAWASAHGEGSDEYFEARLEVARSYRALGSHQQAESLLLDLVERLEAGGRATVSELEEALRLLAALYKELGREPEAREAQRRADEL